MITRKEHYRLDINYNPVEDWKYTPEQVEEHTDCFTFYDEEKTYYLDIHENGDVVYLSCENGEYQGRDLKIRDLLPLLTKLKK